MLWYCGREARVLRRVERIVDERTGQLLRLKRACIVLEGVTCRGEYHRCCPRADYPYWREIWLERVGVRPLLGPLRDLRTLVRFVRERGVRHAARVCALAVRGRWMAAADRRREARVRRQQRGKHRAARAGHRQREPGARVPLRAVTGPARRHAALQHRRGSRPLQFHRLRLRQGPRPAVASHYPFGEVVGVEFSPALHEIAEDNIRKYQSPARRCQNVRSVCADAATFALPEHDCVLYFNNPFAEPVFARVLGNVQVAHERSHGKLHVLYQQLAGELETDRTHNIAMLQHSAFLRERRVRFPSASHASYSVPTSYGSSNRSIQPRRSRPMPLELAAGTPSLSRQ